MAKHRERHRIKNISWLRAAVLGANDGIVSTASLIVGVAAGNASSENILLAGVAGLVAGAMSMAAGEYVSVKSQADTESADLKREIQELATDAESELRELAGIYMKRGISSDLAMQVAVQLTEKDALAAHARDELGINEKFRARPLQAAASSFLAFAVGAFLPLIVVMLSPEAFLIQSVSASSLVFLTLLGILAAYSGGAPIARSALRVTFWGAVAMGITAWVGSIWS
jgi:VIT1/CCC1 family predicted Fe2+/Mn2+ transporter